MIAHIEGVLLNKSVESIIIDVGGVGYEVRVPLSTYYKLPDLRQRVALIVYTHHKEDILQLYGFMTPREKEIFQLLISVSGVGPKLARNVLSGIDAEELAEALAMGDLAKLKGVPGIGAKTAERLILELREKARATATATDEAGVGDKGGILHDIHSALVNLGYKSNQADRAVSEIRKSSDGEESFEELFKRALKALTRG
ncbi:MAG: Holliday junction branch migration protein RuvA [Deltaproteobacteria bacterium]|jgi:Holliday junction DNA helicase RuvA|nr:Holliday junction branch migration protein RuvA [Deltaproteobacteria bacterium]